MLKMYNKVYYDNKHKPPTVVSLHYINTVPRCLCNVDTTIGVNKKLIRRFTGSSVINSVMPHDRYGVVGDITGYQNSQIPYDFTLDSSRYIKRYYFFV